MWMLRMELPQCDGRPREYSLAHLSVIRPLVRVIARGGKGKEPLRKWLM